MAEVIGEEVLRPGEEVGIAQMVVVVGIGRLHIVDVVADVIAEFGASAGGFERPSELEFI